MPLFQRNVKLHVTISWLFVVLTLPVIIAFLLVSYRANTLLIEDYSNKFIEKSVHENFNNAARLLNPIISTARAAGTLMRDKPDYFREPSSSDYLHEIVASNEAVYAAYAAFEDGSFRQVRRVVPGVPVLDKPVPEGALVIDRFIDNRSASNDGVPQDKYQFHGTWGTVLGTDAGPVTYDPRTRGYYKEAAKQQALTVSDVYPFASSGELGITVTAPIVSGGRTSGVMAVDLTLKTLSHYLSDNRVSPNSITIIADDHGGVIAHPEFERGLTRKDKELVQNQLDKLGDPRVTAAIAERIRSGTDRFHFTASPDNTEYIGIFSPFPKDFKKPWELIIITPTDDFVGGIKETNQRLLIFGALAFFLQLILIYRLSKALSRPMEQLAADVSHIRDFQFTQAPMVESRIAEIGHLANAVFLLTRALESFTSYVPRGLVKQLIESGQGTRLGVENRYLTMFFTDLEGFSTLSETEPSQQLLSRVSEYFSSVTQSIEQEHGTMDKYIGDAVMAFWGAPNRVENHAYLACVAAVRSQRRMAIRNREWTGQGMTALKVRIGIHSDSVLVGNVGSAERVSYTVMGDGVNVAARLEGMNKELGTWVCVSHAVYRAAGERLWLRPVDTVTVKGRKGELLVYELLAIRDGDAETAATPEEMQLCQLTTAAYAKYGEGNFGAAAREYTAILEQFPHDSVAQRMLEKCQAGLRAGAPQLQNPL
ncbi:MAG: adenylate/guanylate cyclase domain-containing protein [Rhodoferax sp.]|nr:adenylate/guanylate cyclase domain-containing protein [Rhodoferax sp.]